VTITRRGRLTITITVAAIVVVAVAWLVGTNTSTSQQGAAPPPTPTASTIRASPSPLPTEPTPTPTQPPEPTPIPTEGSGTLSSVPGTDEADGSGDTLRYQVEVEDGLPVEPAEFASAVHETLTDDRGWQSVEDVAFERTTTDTEFSVILASPDTTDEMCEPLDTGGELSCRVGEHVVLNAKRWAEGVSHFDGRLGMYRQYLVNHEVGHALGHDHVDCPAPGEPAPVMMQQTKSIGDCEPNAWPTVSAY